MLSVTSHFVTAHHGDCPLWLSIHVGDLFLHSHNFCCYRLNTGKAKWTRKNATLQSLKHKDSFGKSENLSKTFFTEILVFHPDYECKSSSSIGLL